MTSNPPTALNLVLGIGSTISTTTNVNTNPSALGSFSNLVALDAAVVQSRAVLDAVGVERRAVEHDLKEAKAKLSYAVEDLNHFKRMNDGSRASRERLAQAEVDQAAVYEGIVEARRRWLEVQRRYRDTEDEYRMARAERLAATAQVSQTTFGGHTSQHTAYPPQPHPVVRVQDSLNGNVLNVNVNPAPFDFIGTLKKFINFVTLGRFCAGS